MDETKLNKYKKIQKTDNTYQYWFLQKTDQIYSY